MARHERDAAARPRGAHPQEGESGSGLRRHARGVDGQNVAQLWKRQTLLNVVRMRYADTPVFLDVASIINSYSLAGKVSGSAQLPEGAVPNVLQFGGEGSWSNTPTVTYQPLMGDRFTRSMLQPVPPVAVFQLIQSGWPVDLVLGTCHRATNETGKTSNG